jgi:hypothetical protein
VGDALLEALSPFYRGCLKLFWSGGSMVAGVDAVGGPPHGDFTDKGRRPTADSLVAEDLRRF